MSPVALTHKVGSQFTHTGTIRDLEYRQPDDSVSFWTGKYQAPEWHYYLSNIFT
jgi:hypothetical protein